MFNIFCSAKNEEKKGVWLCNKYKKNKKCSKCLKDKAREVRRSRRKQPVEMKVEDFIDLGEAYFWFLDVIDPFSGMWVSYQTNIYQYLYRSPF